MEERRSFWLGARGNGKGWEGGEGEILLKRQSELVLFLCLTAGIVFRQEFSPWVRVYFLFPARMLVDTTNMVAWP
jgi:hypothetical protein